MLHMVLEIIHRKTYFTVDHVFSMKCLIDIFFLKRKSYFVPSSSLITRRRLTQSGGLDYGPSSLQVIGLYQEKFSK